MRCSPGRAKAICRVNLKEKRKGDWLVLEADTQDQHGAYLAMVQAGHKLDVEGISYLTEGALLLTLHLAPGASTGRDTTM